MMANCAELIQEWVLFFGFQSFARKAEADEGGGWQFTAVADGASGSPYLRIGNDHHLVTGKKTPPRNRVPGDYTGFLPHEPSVEAHDLDLDQALSVYSKAIRIFFGGDPPQRDLSFSVLDGQLQEFRKAAEPIFGSPWLQEIWSAGQPGDVIRVHENIKDWTIQPVAYFKILGSWRVIDLLKEPGGWRFLVTGTYTKDPLKHRHIRDELARKAGMTSETLWEPQEAGEGWLGVPG